jgi:predicted transcriptional regulator
MKILNNWTEKKLSRLKQFYRLQKKFGNVAISDLAEIMQETSQATHLWKEYCIKNGIIEKDAIRYRYVITNYGKEILDVEDE